VALGQRQNRITVPIFAHRVLMRLGAGAAALGDHAHIDAENAPGADHHQARRGVGTATVLGMDHHFDRLGGKLLRRLRGQTGEPDRGRRRTGQKRASKGLDSTV